MASLFPCTVIALQTRHWSLLKVVECKSSSRTRKEVPSIYLLLPSVDVCLQNGIYSRFTPWFEPLYLEMDIFSAQTETHRYRTWRANVYLLI